MPTKLKIVYFTTDLYSGGAEIMLCNLLTRMNRERFEPVVVSLLDQARMQASIGNRLTTLGVPLYTLMRAGRPTLAALWRFITTIRAIRPALIQGWMYHGNLAAQLASIFLFERIPVLWTIHHSIYSLAYEKKMTSVIIRLCAHLSRLPANIIFVSHVSQLQHKRLGYCIDNSRVIPNGIDTSLFQPSIEARLSVRSELGVPERTFLIGLIGRYNPMKDHANFFQAAALLATAHSDIHFLLAGWGVDHKNQMLNQLVRELGLHNQIHMLGERRDVPRLLAALDIATSSSYSEAFPLVIGEAMASGVPCVVTDVGDSAVLVGDTGIVVPPRQAPAIAKAWDCLISTMAEVRRDMGQAARRRIQQHYSLSTIVQNYEDLYISLMGN
jgi:glycosyltransferase involved in cell wall biosynthesis